MDGRLLAVALLVLIYVVVTAWSIFSVRGAESMWGMGAVRFLAVLAVFMGLLDVVGWVLRWL